MTPLSPLDLDLLYFLCAAHHHRCRVTRIKDQRQASLKRLRYAGLVSFDGFIPSPSAIADWLERRNETPVPSDSKAPAESPEPEAIAEGGRRCSDAGASPPKRKAKAKKQSPEAASPSVDPPAVVPTAGRGAALEDPNEARPRSERSKVDIKVNTGPKPARITPVKESQDYQRQAQQALRTNRSKAEAFLDSGKTSSDAGSVSLRIEARKVELRRAEDARLACPLEQAKTKLRRRYAPVCGAEVNGGPAGQFYVGRRLVTEAELLAMAGRVGA